MDKRNIAISLPVTGEDEWLATRESIESGWLTQGPKVSKFENQFAEMHKVKHALAVTSCTTGLHLVLAALGIGKGDEVIVPAFTWVSTANVVLYCGAKPVFVDVSPTTFNLDPEQVSDKITEKTKAIIPVHLFGLCVDMDALRKVIPENIFILEDAACAAGAKYKDLYAGSLGDAAAFSFHPRKSITTGEGGMVTTNNELLFETMSQMRNHGATISEEQRHNGPKPYILPDFNLLGFNYRMTDLQGSVGLAQLPKLESFIEERARWAAYYQEELEGLDWLQTPKEPDNGRHGWQSFVTVVDPLNAPSSRNELMEMLQDKGIASRPGTHAVHMLGLYTDLYGCKPEDFPGAHACNDNTMAIPLHNRMKDEDFEYVVKTLKSF